MNNTNMANIINCEDIFAMIWSEKTKIEYGEKVEKMAKKQFPRVMNELKNMSLKLIDSEDGLGGMEYENELEHYINCCWNIWLDEEIMNINGVSQIYYNIEDLAGYLSEEDYTKKWYYENNPVLVEDIREEYEPYYNGQYENTKYYYTITEDVNEKFININRKKEDLEQYIYDTKEDFGYNGIGCYLYNIVVRGYENAPLHMKHIYLRKTDEEGFGGRRCNTFRDTSTYNENMNEYE